MNTTSQARGRTVKEGEEVRRIVEEAAVRGSALHVAIRGERQIFHSAFETRDEEDLKVVRQGRAILMAPMDPPLGNVKIRFAPEVVVRFSLHDYAVEAEVVLETLLENRTLRLSFPRELHLTPQQRYNDRIPMVPNLPVEMVVWSEEGNALQARVHDLSRGGVAFFTLENSNAELALGGKVRLTLMVQSVTVLELSAELLGTKRVEGQICYRAVFRYQSGRERSVQEHLVSRMEQELKRRRQELFGDAPG